MSRRPTIGVFDSGVGGLTVLKELVRLIPDADYLYFGDTARLPYGSKSPETVAKFALEAVRFLQEHGAEYMVIACNTASALALEAIKSAVKIPVVGVIEPGAERAAIATLHRTVLVIGTEATIGSHAYQRALAARSVMALEKACPLFVPLIEEGWMDHNVTQQVAHVYLDEFFQDPKTGPDTLVLGCTHYPLIKQILRGVAPWRVEIVDSAESTAQYVAKELEKLPPMLPTINPAEQRQMTRLRFFATDSVDRFRRLGERFMGHAIGPVRHVDIGG
ncbi:MAG: glutamate racemase [Acidobacteriia bacterium]|nr:glutamate racemase [Terriglobia bacterium]